MAHARHLLLLPLLWGCAARSASSAPPVVAPAVVQAAAPAAAVPAAVPTATALPPDCPRGASDPAARMAQGQALIAQSMVGEHAVGWDYLWGLQALREAADAGYGPALSAWGQQRFSNLYMNAGPVPDNTAERQAYVVAIAAIATAARLGQADAQAYFPPDVIAGLLDSGQTFPERSPATSAAADPAEQLTLTDVPQEWWEEARQIVQHHRACW